jgi:hypothetical protein
VRYSHAGIHNFFDLSAPLLVDRPPDRSAISGRFPILLEFSVISQQGLQSLIPRQRSELCAVHVHAKRCLRELAKLCESILCGRRIRNYGGRSYSTIRYERENFVVNKTTQSQIIRVYYYLHILVSVPEALERRPQAAGASVAVS